MLKLNKRGGGVAIRMSWYAFFEKKVVGGGTSIPDWRVSEISPKRGGNITSSKLTRAHIIIGILFTVF